MNWDQFKGNWCLPFNTEAAAVQRRQMTDRPKNDAEQVKKVTQTPPGKKKKIN
ncbi:MAG: hypothetical protein Q8O91_04320 [Candidatus Aminicenantes bacterium]|nr:hypothetical protein [Candidatus Aminicenantes bacterium]